VKISTSDPYIPRPRRQNEDRRSTPTKLTSRHEARVGRHRDELLRAIGEAGYRKPTTN
jgi:hypothetical protein